jgi:hypothetical protein
VFPQAGCVAVRQRPRHQVLIELLREERFCGCPYCVRATVMVVGGDIKRVFVGEGGIKLDLGFGGSA